MATLFQVGVGSGGMVVLDLLAREPSIQKVILVEPDVYKPHNVHRHYFPHSDVGASKVELARRWLQERRPELVVETLAVDLMAPEAQPSLEAAVEHADVGVCAVDNEPAKYHFDAMMRRRRKPWTLGEVLSGGIGGWVHRFVPDGPCYGCVASYLQRSIETDRSPPPDYSDPSNVVHEVTVPASKASIAAIASLHALWTLDVLQGIDGGWTSQLLTLQKVPQLFEEAYRPYRFRIPRNSECLICSVPTTGPQIAAEDLDVALDQAIARLGHE